MDTWSHATPCCALVWCRWVEIRWMACQDATSATSVPIFAVNCPVLKTIITNDVCCYQSLLKIFRIYITIHSTHGLGTNYIQTLFSSKALRRMSGFPHRFRSISSVVRKFIFPLADETPTYSWKRLNKQFSKIFFKSFLLKQPTYLRAALKRCSPSADLLSAEPFWLRR